MDEIVESEPSTAHAQLIINSSESATEPVRNQSDSSTTPMLTGSNLRSDLKFYFMDPIEKWEAKRRVPFKLITQVIKIFLITLQIWIFANTRSNHVGYTWNTKIAFSHLFLDGWDSSREIKTYPPGDGPLAIYHKNEFYQAVDYAIDGYKNLSNSIGPYSYLLDEQTGKILPMEFCVYKFLDSKNKTHENYVNCTCFNITIDDHQYDLSDNNINHSIKNLMESENMKLDFVTLIKATLNFNIKTKKYKNEGVDCFEFKISIIFDNSDHSGQLTLSLDTDSFGIGCRRNYRILEKNSENTFLEKILNYTVIAVCGLSFILCIRAIYRAQLLKNRTERYFKMFKNQELTLEDKLHFWNFWYIMIIINDVCIIIGTFLQEQIARSQFGGDQWNVCSIFLGTGNLLVWFGVLRYLGFFRTYNVIMLTLKSSFPNVLRFLSVTILIYFGFVFCGWLVFGPYHMKFRSLSITSECLFSLINGDDMFATFTIIETKSDLLYWYSRFYVYIFTSLFIYVILSLFISIIMDAYETIKQYYEEGFPKSDVEKFIDELDDNIIIEHGTPIQEEHDSHFSNRILPFKKFFPWRITPRNRETYVNQ